MDFARRGIVEALEMRAVLAVEGGKRTVDAWCMVDEKVHSLHPVERVL